MAQSQGQGHNKKTQSQGQTFRGQTLSKSRTGMLEAKAKNQGNNAQVFSKKKKKERGVRAKIANFQFFLEILDVLKKKSLRRKSQIFCEISDEKKSLTLAHF